MNHNEAKQQLQHALKNQQTISIPKLKKLLESLNLDSRSDQSMRELRRQNKRLRKKVERQKDALRRLNDGK